MNFKKILNFPYNNRTTLLIMTKQFNKILLIFINQFYSLEDGWEY